MKKSLQKFKSTIEAAETSLNIRGTNLIFDLLNTQSEIVYPKKEGKKGPNKSAARFMLMASKEKLCSIHKVINGKKIRVFSDNYINQLFDCI